MAVKRIMLVDDEPLCNMVHKKLLQHQDATLEITEYDDAGRAFDALPALSPDVLLLDLNMPGMNGWDFLDAMQAAHINVPVVLLTSSISVRDELRSRQYPNVRIFHSKPLLSAGIGELLSRLNTLLHT